MKKNAEYVGVNDEYIPKNEKYVDESTLNDEKKEKIAKNAKKGGKILLGIGLGYIILVVVFAVVIIGVIIWNFIFFNKVGQKMIDGFDRFNSKFDTIEREINDRDDNNYREEMDEMNKQYKEGEEKILKMLDGMEDF